METTFTTTGQEAPEKTARTVWSTPLPPSSRQESPGLFEEPIPVPPYDPRTVAHMTELLREILDPAYILLFGSLADGTPHSDVIGYDLLIAT